MGLLNKLFPHFYYITDSQTLKLYLEREIKFSIENNLEASADLYVCLNDEKHHIQIWNYSASEDKKERIRGLKTYYDDEEFDTIEKLYDAKFINLPDHFKIELTNSDDIFFENQ